MADDRTTRMAWSTVAAVAVHAAALASWPTFPGGRLAGDLLFAPTPAQTEQAEWIFMDQTAPEGTGSGPGLAAPRPGSAGVASAPAGATPDGVEPDPRGLSDALRDRLVRATSFAPRLAESEGSGGTSGIPIPSDQGLGLALGGSGMTGLSGSEADALEELSALDLERLSALSPEVALEALSNWVLVRNPDQVRDFIVRNPSGAGERSAARRPVSVAIWVSSAGTVEWAEVVTSSGRSEWDELALELFNDVVTFRPARLEGIPMPMSAIFTVDFPW